MTGSRGRVWASAATRSIVTTRSTSHARSSPLSLSFRCVRPLKRIHSGSVSGKPSSMRCEISASVNGSAPDQVIKRHPRLRRAQRVAVQIFTGETQA